MKIKVTKEINFGVYLYTLALKENLKLVDGSWGRTNHVTHTISIDKGLPFIERDLCLLHECLHIIDESYKLHLEEDEIERLQNGLGELLFRDLGIEFDWDELTSD